MTEFKKRFSLLLALCLSLSLSVPAFAAEGEPAPNINKLYVLKLSDGVWSIRIDPAEANRSWDIQTELFLWNNTVDTLELTRDSDGMIVLSIPEGRFFPGDTIAVQIHSMAVLDKLLLNFSTDSKPQFPCEEVARQYSFFDPEEYSVVSPACSDWAKEDVIAALELGLIPRELQCEYAKNITRLEFAKIAMNFCGLQYRCAGSSACSLASKYYGPIEGATSEQFEDCNDDDIRYARSAGLISGVGDNRFEPDREINRAEAATMLLNSYRVYTGDLYDENSILLADAPALTYADAEAVADWAQAPAALLAQWGIMNGVGGNELDPAGFYTREQCIATFMRMWRQAPVSRGRDGASLCPYTCEELLEMKHEWFRTLDPDFFTELPLLESDSVVVYQLDTHGVPPGGNGLDVTVLYKTGGWYDVGTLIGNYNPNNSAHYTRIRYRDISLDEGSNQLLVTLQRRGDFILVTMTIDLDTDRVISVVTASAPAQGQ